MRCRVRQLIHVYKRGSEKYIVKHFIILKTKFKDKETTELCSTVFPKKHITPCFIQPHEKTGK